MAHIRVVPITLEMANTLIRTLHRHHKPVIGAKFSIGCRDKDDDLCGAVIVGRPVARGSNATTTAEVTRLVTDGTPNACSLLYSAAARACAAMGYMWIQTYILRDESGVSLKAAGWEFEAWTAGGDWNNSEKYAGKRRTDQPQGRKQRWVKAL